MSAPYLTLNDYQAGALSTDTTPDKGWEYYTLGVAGEAGELIEQRKKWERDDGGTPGFGLSVERGAKVVKELGDTLWYIALVADRLGLTLEEVAQINLRKLAERQANGTIHGAGDDR